MNQLKRFSGLLPARRPARFLSIEVPASEVSALMESLASLLGPRGWRYESDPTAEVQFWSCSEETSLRPATSLCLVREGDVLWLGALWYSAGPFNPLGLGESINDLERNFVLSDWHKAIEATGRPFLIAYYTQGVELKVAGNKFLWPSAE
jgi:hypothetical protein